jgi:hypothetical protein
MELILELAVVGRLLETNGPGDQAVDDRLPALCRGLQAKAREHFFFGQLI